VQHNEIAARVRDYIVGTFLFGDGSRLTDETSFLESSILDSTGMLELISFVEQEFGFSIDPTELVPDNLDSISKVAAFVERKKGTGAVDQAA
jgi:acyl carrier protein